MLKLIYSQQFVQESGGIRESFLYLKIGFYTKFLREDSQYTILGSICPMNYSLSQNPLMWHDSRGGAINVVWSLGIGAINAAQLPDIFIPWVHIVKLFHTCCQKINGSPYTSRLKAYKYQVSQGVLGRRVISLFALGFSCVIVVVGQLQLLGWAALVGRGAIQLNWAFFIWACLLGFQQGKNLLAVVSSISQC